MRKNAISLQRVTIPQIRAFSVHLLTASGSFFAFLSLVAASQSHWVPMFCWLGIALLVDGIDGPIARRLQVQLVLPTWSGELLDNVLDYVTYVLIPAFALWKGPLLPESQAFFAGVVIVVSSAIYYADTSMKTKENFFKGFPVVWNMVVFGLFVLAPPPAITLATVCLSAIISFLPINFLHPVRVERLRFLNLSCFFAWCIFAAFALFYGFKVELWQVPLWVKGGLMVTSFYLYCIGGILQLFPTLGQKAAN